jgi:cysteine-rich repeat protein
MDTGEQCDDGNETSGDGCSDQCQVEDGYECFGTPSTCTLMCGNQAIDGDEECDGQDFGSASCSDFGFDSGMLSCTSSCTIDTSGCLACNQDGLVQELGSNDFDAGSQLQGELMTRYEEVTNSLQSQALEATCEQDVEIFGARVPGIVVSVDDQHFVHFRIESADFVVDRLFFSYFGAAELAVSTDNPLEQEIYGDGDVIFIHSGENITVKRGWNATGTVGTIAGIFTATYNRRQEVDGWFWEIVPQTDMVKPFEFGNDSNSIIIGTDDSGLPYYLDKANAHDLSEIGRKPNTGGGGGGCNQANCSQSNGAASLGVMFGILMLWLLLGLRRSRRSAPGRIKENDRKDRKSR